MTKTYTCPATDGNYNRKAFKKTFTGWLDSDIENYGCDHDDAPTAAFSFTTQKLSKDSTFMDMFGDCTVFWTKAQIKAVIETTPELFNQKGYGNFFLYKNERGKRFVFYVDRCGGEWDLHVDTLEYGNVWDAQDEHVLFFPQQDSKALSPSSDTLSLMSLCARVEKLEKLVNPELLK